MKMSSKARYGLYAAVELAKGTIPARWCPSAPLPNARELRKISGTDIGADEKQNVVVAVRGANGGYKLKNPPQSTTVGQVLRAVEDNLEIVDCLHKSCSAKCNCVSRNLWAKLYDNINSYLDTISLKQLSEDDL